MQKIDLICSRCTHACYSDNILEINIVNYCVGNFQWIYISTTENHIISLVPNLTLFLSLLTIRVSCGRTHDFNLIHPVDLKVMQ